MEYTTEWRSSLMGQEGYAAAEYWNCIKAAGIASTTFAARVGRGASDAFNQALNYGYGILTSRIWQAISNAGLEPYAGLLHVERPGKPSLVLDLMEEYRAWVVDRIVIKNRSHLNSQTLNPEVRNSIAHGVLNCLASNYPYRGKRLSLEGIIQRQVYSLVAVVSNQKKTYKPYTFKW